MSRRGIGPGVVIAGLALGLVGCNGSSGPPKFEGPPVRVTCTTTIVADAVTRVGGDRVQVEALMGPGLDPHKHIPAAGDLKKFDGAHLVFFNGLHLEGKMADLFEKNKDRWRAHAVAGRFDHAKLLKADVDGGEHDPHVWFDVQLWKGAVEVVRDELAALDPGGADTYGKNAADYLKELDALDAEIRRELDKVPAGRRVLVTSHDAFGYFGRAYGFEVLGLQGVSTASETGTAQRSELANTLTSRKIPAVFTETSVPDDGLRGVLEDAAKRGHAVKLVGGESALYSDSLGAPGTPGETYSGMVRHNVRVIVEALK